MTLKLTYLPKLSNTKIWKYIGPNEKSPENLHLKQVEQPDIIGTVPRIQIWRKKKIHLVARDCNGRSRISQTGKEGSQSQRWDRSAADLHSKFWTPPSNFLHFHVVFGNIWLNNRLVPTPLGLPPTPGKS